MSGRAGHQVGLTPVLHSLWPHSHWSIWTTGIWTNDLSPSSCCHCHKATCTSCMLKSHSHGSHMTQSDGCFPFFSPQNNLYVFPSSSHLILRTHLTVVTIWDIDSCCLSRLIPFFSEGVTYHNTFRKCADASVFPQLFDPALAPAWISSELCGERRSLFFQQVENRG